MAAARDELVYWQMLREHLVNNAPQSVASIALNPSLRMNGPLRLQLGAEPYHKLLRRDRETFTVTNGMVHLTAAADLNVADDPAEELAVCGEALRAFLDEHGSQEKDRIGLLLAPAMSASLRQTLGSKPLKKLLNSQRSVFRDEGGMVSLNSTSSTAFPAPARSMPCIIGTSDGQDYTNMQFEDARIRLQDDGANWTFPDAVRRDDGNAFAALDLEGDLQVNGSIALAQIAFTSRSAILLEPARFDGDSDDERRQALKDVLEGLLRDVSYILVHDCHADALALGEDFFNLPTLEGKWLDTQLVYERITGELFGGLNEYLAEMHSEGHPTKNKMHAQMDHDATYWTTRPLSDEKYAYAAADVLLLQCTTAALEQRFREDPVQLQQLLDATAQRIRSSLQSPGKRSITFNPSRNLSLASAEATHWLSPLNETQTPHQRFQMSCDLDDLLALTPDRIETVLRENYDLDYLEEDLLELILDLGRPPRTRWLSGGFEDLVGDSEERVTEEDLMSLEHRLAATFGPDNRAGLDGQLHRISAIRNRQNRMIGATMRVGRHFQGNCFIISDLLLHPENRNKSILILGPPGSGKTSVIREIANVLSQHQLVVVVDTSNEICGAGDIAHPCVGRSRRMMVPSIDKQHDVMVECVQNHMPDVMIIDEIGRPREALAARTCKERHVRIIASAHGDFQGLVRNNELQDLVGGVREVTYSDETAKLKKSKVGNERAKDPTFEIIIELKPQMYDTCVVIQNVPRSVDDALLGKSVKAQQRTRYHDGEGMQRLDCEFITLARDFR